MLTLHTWTTCGVLTRWRCNGIKFRRQGMFPRADRTVLWVLIVRTIGLSCLVEVLLTRDVSTRFICWIGRRRNGQRFYRNRMKKLLGKGLIIRRNFFIHIWSFLEEKEWLIWTTCGLLTFRRFHGNKWVYNKTAQSLVQGDFILQWKLATNSL